MLFSPFSSLPFTLPPPMPCPILPCPHRPTIIIIITTTIINLTPIIVIVVVVIVVINIVAIICSMSTRARGIPDEAWQPRPHSRMSLCSQPGYLHPRGPPSRVDLR